jgi:hypothetical protein
MSPNPFVLHIPGEGNMRMVGGLREVFLPLLNLLDFLEPVERGRHTFPIPRRRVSDRPSYHRDYPRSLQLYRLERSRKFGKEFSEASEGAGHCSWAMDREGGLER